VAADAAPDAAELVALLASHERLRVVSALVLGATSTDDVVAATALPHRAVLEALGRLEVGGLVDRVEDGTWQLLTERFAQARPVAATEPRADYPDASPEAAAVLHRFIRGGRLLSIPTQRAKRLVVLDHVARGFEPGRRYTEREVSEQLALLYDDYAALRRYLVDEEFLSRADGVYWRSGGTVSV
jgi:hypothetical protein